MASKFDAERLYGLLYPAAAEEAAVPPEALALPGPALIEAVSFEMDTKWTDAAWLRQRFEAMNTDVTASDKKNSYAFSRRSNEGPPPPTRRTTTPALPTVVVAGKKKKEDSAVAGGKSLVLQGQQTASSLRASAQKLRMDRLSSQKCGRKERRRAQAAYELRQKLMEVPAMRSGMRRLGAAAALFEPTGAYAAALDGESMTPTALSDFLYVHFQLHLTPEELGCVFWWLDVNGDGRIDAAEFLCEFWKFAEVERKRRSAETRDRLATTDWKRRMRYEATIRRFGGTPTSPEQDIIEGKLSLVDVRGKAFTPSHLEGAVASLRKAAFDFDAHSAYGLRLRDLFQGKKPLSPATLAAMIRRLFHVTLAPEHLVALVGAHPSPDTPGLCDGNHFYRTFAKLGRDERQRRQQAKRRANEAKAKRFTNRSETFLQAATREAHVVYPDLAALQKTTNDDDNDHYHIKRTASLGQLSI